MQILSAHSKGFPSRESTGDPGAPGDGLTNPRHEIGAALLTGGKDRPYAFGLAMALTAKNIRLDVVGSDETDSPEMHDSRRLRFLNLHGTMKSAPVWKKTARVLAFYCRLAGYVAGSSPPVLHILWNNNFEWFDRTVLMLYYRLLGKKIAITAHNVNAAQRDSTDSMWNRITLRIQYQLAHHIFVHTKKMESQLSEEFGVRKSAITVIRHPVNDAFPDTDLTPAQAKQRLGIRPDDKTMLFFGRLRPYKGLEYLLFAFESLLAQDTGYRLIIAGESKKGSEKYFDDIDRQIKSHPNREGIIERIEFIPDEDAELYLKAADVMVLPYKDIFQSGVLFLAYSFGLPVVAADVGSFREEIVEGKTGFICRPCDTEDLAKVLRTYFASDLFKSLSSSRQELRDYAHAVHSWDAVAGLTRKAYDEMLRR